MARNPRINVSLSEEQHELLLDLARLENSSASALIRALVDQAEPLFRALLPVLQASEKAREKFAQEIGRLGEGSPGGADARQVDIESFIQEMGTAVRGDLQEPRAAGTGLHLVESDR